ncbi:zinc-dependent metalloprotease [Parafilimonas sp.]|uniref:zinc-dependent metalloprotease n=1 Tax=Parafilimonas sp. TaxID=1969739 RepID=UPI0039E64E98
MKHALLLLLLLPVATIAQLPSIAVKTKGLKRTDGFIPFYMDEANNKIYLEINKPDSELLYLTSLPAGLGSNDIGLDRGLTGDQRIVKFTRTGNKVLLVQPNYSYRAVTDDKAEQRAVEQSFAQSVLWGFTVEAETGKAFLIDASAFFLRDAMQAANRIRNMNQGSYNISPSRCALYLPYTKNFPLNTEIEATITFTNEDGKTGNYVNAVTPSPEAITLRMHHSFVQLPDNNYKPRAFDPRSSFFNISYADYSTPVSEPIQKYFICRHRLQKKNPGAAISEVVKPIVYYVDNGTPEPIRSALVEGAGWWAQAFEAAGFKNAFIVKVLPDSADPMDARYNVINWVHRATRGWSYGAGIVDPRTGEIIKGQVTLGSLRVRQDYLIAEGLLAPYKNGTPADDKMMKMALARLRQLAAHETGHTLGLMHNYSASTVNRSSVMDYPSPLATINSSGDIDLSDAYDNKIGDWDKVSIAWGYGDFPSTANEKDTLNSILANAYNSGLRFLTDQDARPAGAASSYADLWDNGNDVIDGLDNVIKVRAKALQQFGENNIKTGTPMAMLEDVLVPVYFYHRYQLEAVTKIIGGLDYTYALRGDGQQATTPVSKEEQLRAMKGIIACINPQFLELPQKIVDMIPPRPAGYIDSRELFTKRTGLPFDALSPAETAADFPLSFLFNAQRISRMEQYGATGGLSVSDMITMLMDSTWKAPRKNGQQALIQRQTEQVLLTYLLALSVDDKAGFAAQADAVKALKDLEAFIQEQQKTSKDDACLAHLALALQRMKNPQAAKPTLREDMPPGAPIGCDWDD